MQIEDRTNGKTKALVQQETKEKIIKIPLIQYSVMEVTVRGTSPIMMHAFSAKAKQEMADNQLRGRKLSRKEKDACRKPKIPKDEFEGACYRHPDYPGALCVPAISFKQAMIAMVRQCVDVKMTQAKIAFRVEGELLPILSPDTGKPIKVTFEKHCRCDAVRIGSFGSEETDLRYRPCISEPWAVKLRIRFSPATIDAQSVVNLLTMAGEMNGVGEWRPGGKESTGQFGCFSVSAKDMTVTPVR